jgi:hypothetical protein
VSSESQLMAGALTCLMIPLGRCRIAEGCSFVGARGPGGLRGPLIGAGAWDSGSSLRAGFGDAASIYVAITTRPPATMPSTSYRSSSASPPPAPVSQSVT